MDRRTFVASGASGFVEFCATRGKQISNRVNQDPTFAQYVLAVGAQQPSLFSAWPSSGGHSTVVEGYVSAINNATRSALDVVVIADGWQDAGRYINFHYPALLNPKGAFFF